ncbi:anti-sigma factor family protein [Streptomyces sp. NPDC088725]|uniref:anti-sigma factor family protein n=1 Tax=Streptomyces sp. NPDC088725 TaxID=3365873 RepID=UPI003814112E
MSGTSPTPAEQHLGDRLAALVDGELDHDARERVQAHLATCCKCKAEADSQRRLKSFFAQAAPPPPSAGFLAKLQGLPERPPGSPDGDDDGDSGRGFPDAGRFGSGVFGVRTDGFGYVPAPSHSTSLPGSGSGFRIHEVGRQEAERSPWRGKRFAFAAASAVSFAAMALGGTMPLGTGADVMPQGAGNSVTPVRAPGVPAAASVSTETGRRQSGRGGAPRESADRATDGPPPGMLQERTASAPLFSTVSLRSPSPLVVPPGAALRADAVSAVGPSVTPSPTALAAPTLPAAPRSLRH